jgi:all-trans-retinol dehydrogenase (NAD+)
MDNSFLGKIVVITGASSGLGRRLSELFDDSGAIVFALDIDEKMLQTISSGRSKGYHPMQCDLSKSDSIRQVFQQIYSILGENAASKSQHIDILINNAGIVYGRSVEEHTTSQIEQTFAVNTLSHFYTVQAVLPEMKRHNSGHIVTIASAGGFAGAPGMSAYSASKFAAIGFEEALRGEIKSSGKNIKTTLVAPYFVNTGMFEGVRTRFSWLLPILDQEYVSRRIFKAIQTHKKRLIMPRFVYLVFPLRMLPVGLFDWLSDFFGISRSMKHFKGRTDK